MSQLQRVMIANALLVMLVSMFAGFMLMFNLIGGFEIWPGKILEFSVYGTTEGWVRAHTGGVTNALLVMAIAFTLPHINVSEFQEKFLAYGFIMLPGLSQYSIGWETLRLIGRSPLATINWVSQV